MDVDVETPPPPPSAAESVDLAKSTQGSQTSFYAGIYVTFKVGEVVGGGAPAPAHPTTGPARASRQLPLPLLLNPCIPTAPQDLSYTVATKKGEATLLHGVSGYLRPGELAALMG